MKLLIIFPLLLSIACGRIYGQQKIEFTAPGVYPEGIVYHPGQQVFYVSGVRIPSVGKLDKAGRYTQLFIDTTLRSVYGMKLDPAGNKLWFCASDGNYSKYKSAATFKKMMRLVAIDLTTGKKTNDIDLSSIAIGEHFANDLVLDNRGNIYITDSYSPNIYKVDGSGTVSVFSNSALFYAAGIGLNGLVYHPSGFLLAVNSGAGALLKISLSNAKEVTKIKIPQFFPGGDGMLLDDNNTITLVQNQSVNKVFKIHTSDEWKSAKVIMATKSDALFAQPSTATFAGTQTWIMNSKLNELADSMHIPSKTFSIQQAVFFPVK